MDRGDLQHLSKDELIDLVLRLQRPEKTSRTSSKPPSSDRKARREASKPGCAKAGHEGHNRQLAESADRIVEYMPIQCTTCGAPLSGDGAVELIGEYDAIDLPAVSPYVVRHRRFACRCPDCGARVKAPVPPQARGTPFGPRVHALAVYLKTFQALSYERLQRLFFDLFGLRISQGALMNMFARTAAPFKTETNAAIARLRAASSVASDETGVRIEGLNAFHWVFRCKDAVVHVPDFTRAAEVVRTMMDGHRPEVWLSDRYSAQQKHAKRHQTCLAHLARDVAYADEHGEDDLPSRFKLWFGRAFALAADITTFAPSTIATKRRALERQLDDMVKAPTACPLTRDLQAKIGRARHQLLTFCDFPGEVDATNNASHEDFRVKHFI